MKIFAWFVSIVMQPLLMLTFAFLLLLSANPYLFGYTPLQRRVSLLSLFITTFVLPCVAIVLLKLLGFIKSVDLYERQDRIIPFIICGIFYLWVYLGVMRDQNMPLAMNIFTLGTILSLTLAFVISLFFKISLHASGVSGLVGMVAITMWLFAGSSFNLMVLGQEWVVSMNLVLLLTLFLAGLTGWSRLYLGSHTPRELYAGYVLGILGQFVALKVLF